MTSGSYAYNVFRGINKANSNVRSNDTTMIDLARDFAKYEDNKAAITITLEDFSEKFSNFHGKGNSNINADDAKKGFIKRVLKSEDTNIFETETAQKALEENGNLFQDDIFEQALVADNGIKYKEDGDDLYKSALNFARADIEAIEKAYTQAYVEMKSDGKLDLAEIKSYASLKNMTDVIEKLDLDGNTRTISAEEYASYLIAADGLIRYGSYDEKIGYTTSNGLIDANQAEIAKDFNNAEFQKLALEIYNEYYKN